MCQSWANSETKKQYLAKKYSNSSHVYSGQLFSTYYIPFGYSYANPLKIHFKLACKKCCMAHQLE